MSGRKQHTIPRLVMRGFVDPAKPSHVWMYRRNKSDILVNLNDAGAERDFYSGKDTDESADDKITRYESETLAKQINALRALGDRAPVEQDLAAEVVTHLVTRAAHVRDAFGGIAEALLRRIKALGSDPEFWKGIMGLGPEHGDLARKFIAARLAETPDLKISPQEFDALVGRFEDMFAKRYVAFAASWAEKPELKQLPPGFLQDLQKKQAETLVTDMVPSARFARMKSFKWTIEKRDRASFILPDCIAVEFKGDDVRSSFAYEHDDPDSVIFPLASNAMLVGRGSPNWEIPSEVNAALASCSTRYFVASQPGYQEWAPRIGGRMEEVLGGLLKNAFGPTFIRKIADQTYENALSNK